MPPAEALGQVVLITGGSGGVGSCAVRAFAQAHYDVGFTYHNAEARAKLLAEEVQAVGRRCIAMRSDLRHRASAKQVVSTVERELGAIAVVVNNVGGGRDRLFLIQSEDEFWETLHLNIGSVANVCWAAIPHMLRRRSGVVINVTSVSASRGVRGRTGYSASKAAIEGFSRSLTKEVASFGIRVLCIAPGMLETDMISGLPEAYVSAYRRSSPIGRLGEPDEVAAMLLALAGPAGVLAQGHVITLDGGSTA